MTCLSCRDISQYLWVLFVVFPPVRNISGCDGNDGCCLNYYWNENYQNCSKCPPGYTGLNCSLMCGYPSYGEGCEGECQCPQHECNFISGCPNTTSTVLYSSTIYEDINGTGSNEDTSKDKSAGNISNLNILSLCILILVAVIIVIFGAARVRKYIIKRNLYQSDEIQQTESHYQEIPNNLVLTCTNVGKEVATDKHEHHASDL